MRPTSRGAMGPVSKFRHVPRQAPERPPKRRPPGGNPAANFNGIGNISNETRDSTSRRCGQSLRRRP
jgi:hypothetical protein